MADSRFYACRGPFSIEQIERLAAAKAAHSSASLISDIAPLDSAGPGQIAYCDRQAFVRTLKVTKASAVFVPQSLSDAVPLGTIGLITANPHLSFCAISKALYPDIGADPQFVAIDPSARIGRDVVVLPNVTIGPGVEIGDGTTIGAGAVIGRGVKIGTGCRIGSQVTIGFALIGDNVSIFPGARIGCDGFGYAPGPSGLVKVPQLGRVILQDHVEIGANSCVDRGAMADTVIGEGTKIDNLVQVAHNVVIGRYCVLAAQCGISGSVKIGDFVMMGGQVGVADHVTIGDKSQIAGQSGVTRNLPGGEVYGGFPAKPVRFWRREIASLSRLAQKKRNTGDDISD